LLCVFRIDRENLGASSWHRTTPLPVTGRETNKKERKEKKEKQKGIFAILRVL